MMINYDDDLALRHAWDYQSPQWPAATLPLVYGDMTSGGAGGLWPAVCVDTENLVYALAGHPLMGQTRLFDANGQELTSGQYTLKLSDNFEGMGPICTATLAEAPLGGQLLARGLGKADATGALLENPLDIVADIIANQGHDPATVLHGTAFNRARAVAAAAGLRAAGVVMRTQRLADFLTAFMGEFLGSWWQDGQGRLKLLLDLGGGALDEGELSSTLRPGRLRNVEVSAALADVVNRAEMLYCLNHADENYLAVCQGQEQQDLLSQGVHGVRSRSIELNWVRDKATAQTIGRRLVELLGVPRRMIYCEETDLAHINLEKGDAALISLPWLYDADGQGLANQIVRVLSVEPQLDQRTIRLGLMDTGCFKTVAQRAAGPTTAEGTVKAGGDRDRRAL